MMIKDVIKSWVVLYIITVVCFFILLMKVELDFEKYKRNSQEVLEKTKQEYIVLETKYKELVKRNNEIEKESQKYFYNMLIFEKNFHK